MGIKFANNAISVLAAPITNSATNLTVTAGEGSKFPVLGGGDYFRVTLQSAGAMEIVKVTAQSIDTFTIVRGEEGTTPVAFALGSAVSLYTTAQDLYDLASKWTTPRLLAGNSVDGSVDKPFANKFIVQGTADAGLSGAQFMGAQSTGLVKNITGTGVLTIATMGLDYMQPQAVTGIVKSNIQTWSAAVPGTDYLAPPAGLSIQKANNGGALANAVPGTDYVSPSGTETVSNKTLTNATIYATTVSATMNGQGSNGPGALSVVCNDSGFATMVWGSANTYFCVSKGGAENALYFTGNIKALGYDVAAATLHSTGNANINGEAIIGGSAWVTGGGSFGAAVTASKLGVNTGSIPAPFIFYNNGMAWGAQWAVPPSGFFGSNLYYSGGWKFIHNYGYAGYLGMDGSGGITLSTTSAQSSANDSAANPISRLYIDQAGVVTVGDVVTHRGNDTGVVYLGNSKGHYLYFDGGKFQIFGGAVVTASSVGVVCSAPPIAPLDVQPVNDRHFVVGINGNNLVQLGSMSNGGAGWLDMSLVGGPYVYPSVDSAFHFGSGSFRWNTIYALTGTINTSDERLKTDIQDSALGLDFVEALRPVSYKWIVGGRKVTREPDGEEIVPETIDIDGTVVPATTRTKYKDVVTDIPGVRPHWGMIAQDVHSAMKAKGIADFGGFIMDDPLDANSTQSLRYDEFIAPMIKAIQELSAKVKALEAQLAAKPT